MRLRRPAEPGNGFGGERRSSALVQRVAQIGAKRAREHAHAVRHGVAVDVALRVLVAHVRYLGQASLAERAHSVGGESDRGSEGGGTADRRLDIHA